MKVIKEEEKIREIEKYMKEAEKEAMKSGCKKAKVGVVIVKDGKIIARGYNKITVSNSQFPEFIDEEGACIKCLREGIHGDQEVEMCFAIHAEQMALINAKEDLKGAVMYHVKIKNGRRVPITQPTCTVCSRMIKEAGVYFVTLQKEGYVMYSPEEINETSFRYILEGRSYRNLSRE